MNNIAAQLRSVKHRDAAGGLSVDAKLAGKRAMLTAIGGTLEGDASASLRSTYLLWLSQSFISRPVALGVAAFVLAGSGLMTTVNAAQQSLPGDMLYSVKRINERAQLQLASLDRRAVLHTEFAQRRLHEVERLQSNTTTRDTSIVTDTMNAYTQEVASANQNLRELQASGNTSTVATANQVDRQLTTLNESLTKATVPLSSTDGSVATSSALAATQGAKEDVVTVAVEVSGGDETDGAGKDLQEIFMRQFGEITTRKTFDDHRISVIRNSLKEHASVLANSAIISGAELTQLERAMDIVIADVLPTLDTFRAGEHRTAFDALKLADQQLRAIEITIAEIETAITSAMMQAREGGTSDTFLTAPQAGTEVKTQE